MKRILCVIDSLGSGGAQRQMAELTKLLHDKGYVVRVVFWVYYPQDHFLQDELTQHGVDWECQKSMQKSLTRIFKIRKAINEFHPDVVISYYTAASQLLCIDNLLRKRRYNLIVSERTITREASLKSTIKHQMYRMVNYIVPNSTTETTYIKQHYPFLSKKVFTINNFVDETKFYPIEKSVSGYEQTNALFVGRYNAAKNIPSLLRALGMVAKSGLIFHVDFYGRDIAEHCNELVAELNLEEYVSFRGQSRTIEDVYRSHNLFIIDSRWEGFPNVLCEAMCCGLPVIGSRVSDIPYIMEDRGNGFLVNPLDEEDVAQKISEYLLLPIQQKYEMGRKSVSLSNMKFSKKRFLESYIKLIEE